MLQRLCMTALLCSSFALLTACGDSEQQAASEPVKPEATIPADQMAMVQEAGTLVYESVPVLEPGEGQVLIQVYAAAVNPVDWKMRSMGGGGGPPAGGAPGGEGGAPPGGAPGGAPGGEGAAPPGGGAPGAGGPPGGGGPMGGGSSQSIPGFDVAGVVAKVGPGVTSFKEGDAVFSMIGRVQVDGLNGGYSQYAIAPVDNVVAKPTTLTYAQAAGLGTVGLAASRMINMAGGIKEGQRVFIQGIAGGVGSSAAQIAKASGAYVIGTATTKHHEYLTSIGVDQAIDYKLENFVDVVTEPVDVVLNTVSAATATSSIPIVKKGGVIASIAGSPDAAACEAAEVECPRGAGPGDTSGPSEGDYLRQVGALAQAGKFSINVDATFPLAEALAAQEENENGGTEGKIILIVDEAMANMK